MPNQQKQLTGRSPRKCLTAKTASTPIEDFCGSCGPQLQDRHVVAHKSVIFLMFFNIAYSDFIPAAVPI
ncbi:MAG: hypothetical protein AVDCRST_MAG93-4212 [uncultured Chloroflexia bacterium]|uniref:Uncharacterized protein n=1 Tax=uncultured Chloroflexia bacterium TaxID=1672391 RepID=A0A6J4K5A6_9CHLR|nr:MAG: hypothetical protein AVDCRST_MAG93-4212 [uncultured Chloroflexia bacterium]